MKSYSELLRDPQWQKKRLEIMSRADFMCENCGDSEKTLAVHHKLYRRGAKPWEYEDHELICVCEDCHSTAHALRDELNSLLATGDESDLYQIVGYLKGHQSRLFNSAKIFTIGSWEEAAGFVDAWRANISPHGFIDLVGADSCQISGDRMKQIMLEQKKKRD